MVSREDKNWELLNSVLSAESSGKSPRLFSSRKSLFGIPSTLDQELAKFNEPQVQSLTVESAAEKPASDKTAPSNGDKKTPQNSPTRVIHPLKPVYNEESRVLILGTIPSPKSRETGFYYNHPQNRFWKVMAALFNEPLPESNTAKEALVLEHGIALWDVLSECTIEGASDGSIAECVPNNIASILSKAPIEVIFCTGAKATELYQKYCEPQTRRPCIRLASTSPANAAKSLDQLIEEYRQILPYCR